MYTRHLALLGLGKNDLKKGMKLSPIFETQHPLLLQHNSYKIEKK